MKKLRNIIFTAAILTASLCPLSCSKNNPVEEKLDYLCFTALLDSCEIRFEAGKGMDKVPVLEYSFSGEGDWNSYRTGEPIALSRDESVYFRGDNQVFSYLSAGGDEIIFAHFAMVGQIEASGNIMSLVDKTCKTTAIPCEYCFTGLFAEECKGLNYGPEMPATSLKKGCYEGMYYGCVNLEEAPELPATVMEEGCYYRMFQDCTKMKESPVLHARTLAVGCYAEMFSGCLCLERIEVDFTDWTPEGATSKWVEKVPESGTFVCPGSLAGKLDDSHIPANWEIKTR